MTLKRQRQGLPPKEICLCFQTVKMETFFSLKTFQDNKNKTFLSSFKRYLLTSQDNEDNVSLAGRMNILSGSPNISLPITYFQWAYRYHLALTILLLVITVQESLPLSLPLPVILTATFLLWVINDLLSLTQTSHVSLC